MRLVDRFADENKADFEHWLRLGYWTLAEGLCLAFGIEPSERMAHHTAKTVDGEKLYQMLNRACNSYIVDRLHLKNTPQDFINWLQSKNFTLPKELLQVINKQNLNDLMMQNTEQAKEENPAEPVNSISDTPESDSAQDVVTLSSSPVVQVTLPHMTEGLKKFFQVMRDSWGNYDPSRPPKQINIAHEIDNALGWKSQKGGSASRNGQALASLIRPDELRELDKRVAKRGN